MARLRFFKKILHGCLVVCRKCPDELAEGVKERFPVGLGYGLEKLANLVPLEIFESLYYPQALGGNRNKLNSPVIGVTLTNYEPPVFQPVEDTGHGRCRGVGNFSQFCHTDRAAGVQDGLDGCILGYRQAIVAQFLFHLAAKDVAEFHNQVAEPG